MFAEVDRQLAEVRAACNDIAARSGILLSATGVGAALIASRIDHLKHGVVSAMWALGLASVLGLATLISALVTGPRPTDLMGWATGPAVASVSALWGAKVTTLEANRDRLLIMTWGLRLQSVAVLVATALALTFTAVG